MSIAIVLVPSSMRFSNDYCMMLCNNLLHAPSNFCNIIECVPFFLRALRECRNMVHEGSCMCCVGAAHKRRRVGSTTRATPHATAVPRFAAMMHAF